VVLAALAYYILFILLRAILFDNYYNIKICLNYAVFFLFMQVAVLYSFNIYLFNSLLLYI